MSKEIQITQLSLVILARSHNPSLLNPDFLKINGIIDENWITAAPTFSTEQVSQVIFKEGISLILQPDKLIIDQNIEGDFKPENIFLPKIACQYLKTLPHVNYIAFGINPISFVPFESEESVDNYVCNQLLRPGDWKFYQDSTLEVSPNFTYMFKDFIIRLGLTKVIKIDDENPDIKTFGMLFSGNVHRDIVLTGASQDRIIPLIDRVDLWYEDVNSFLSIINNCLLSNSQ
ncbi:MAG: hypothetical protein VKL42_00850 [Snowella sp.]|nr:hypothetical protein [Snowella sp.]